MTARRPLRTGTASACGSCGELVQGVLLDGREFQVTLPIDLFSSAHVVAVDGPEWVVDVEPQGRRKAAVAAVAMARRLQSSPLHISVTIDSAIPIGAGLGSSTADIVAAARATANAGGADVTPHEIGRIAGAIEASDGTMHAGMCVTDRRGALLEALPWAPSFHVVVLMPEDRYVITDDVALGRQRMNAATYSRLVDDLRAAAGRRDPRPFVEAAMTSAAMNQAILPNDLVALAPGLCRDTGAAGWNVAHTGTALGLLFHDPVRATAATAMLSAAPPRAGIRIVRATSLTGAARAWGR